MITAAYFASDTIIEVDLELRPSCQDIQSIDFFTERLRVLITLLEMLGSQANQVNLKRHSFPFLRSEFVDELLNIINNSR